MRMAGHEHPDDGRNGSGEGEVPGREACLPGSDSETLGHDGTRRNSPVLPVQTPCSPLSSISLLLAELAKAEVQAPQGGGKRSPTETSFLLSELGLLRACLFFLLFS